MTCERQSAGSWRAFARSPGGHVEDGEDPRRAVEREMLEELGLPAVFHPRIGARLPFFLTATPTLPTPRAQSHVDISMWFVLACDRTAELRPDPREFRSVQWLEIDEQLD